LNIPQQTIADLTVILHFLYVLFVAGGEFLIILGGLLGWKWVRNIYFRLSHLLAIIIVALLTILNLSCPLTLFEFKLRQSAGQEPSEIRFIPRLIRKLLFWDLPAKFFFWLYLGFALLVMITFMIFRPSFKKFQ